MLLRLFSTSTTATFQQQPISQTNRHQLQNISQVLHQSYNMSNSAQTSVYPPLDHSTSQIRLIHLQPYFIVDDEDIHCTLSLANLEDSSCRFEALSYEWGDATDVSHILLLNSRRLLVRLPLERPLPLEREGKGPSPLD